METTICEMTVHSQHNCYAVGQAAMDYLQNNTAVSTRLEVGTNLIKISGGSFNYKNDSGHSGEPLVMIWIYGGKVTNNKTGVLVSSTWESINGYDDNLTLEVTEPATLCAFFFDTYIEDNDGEVQLSIARI